MSENRCTCGCPGVIKLPYSPYSSFQTINYNPPSLAENLLNKTREVLQVSEIWNDLQGLLWEAAGNGKIEYVWHFTIRNPTTIKEITDIILANKLKYVLDWGPSTLTIRWS